MLDHHHEVTAGPEDKGEDKRREGDDEHTVREKNIWEAGRGQLKEWREIRARDWTGYLPSSSSTLMPEKRTASTWDGFQKDEVLYSELATDGQTHKNTCHSHHVFRTQDIPGVDLIAVPALLCLILTITQHGQHYFSLLFIYFSVSFFKWALGSFWDFCWTCLTISPVIAECRCQPRVHTANQ